jgi:hypothetical protein
MAINRYQNDPPILGGKLLGTATAVANIRRAVSSGDLLLMPFLVRESQRLDKIAGEFYGDGRLWWVIAAASNIGWSLQVPPGTRLSIPRDLSQVAGII